MLITVLECIAFYVTYNLGIEEDAESVLCGEWVSKKKKEQTCCNN